MKNEKGQAARQAHPNNPDAKVIKKKQLCKIVDYLSLYDGSTLSVSDATGVPRCSVCYYIQDLVQMEIIGLIGRYRGRTGRKMKVYSCDRSKWITNNMRELSLFELWEKGGRHD